jgi:hypothetical protein
MVMVMAHVSTIVASTKEYPKADIQQGFLTVGVARPTDTPTIVGTPKERPGDAKSRPWERRSQRLRRTDRRKSRGISASALFVPIEFPRRPLLGSFITKRTSPDQKNNYAAWPLDVATNYSGNVCVSGPASYAKTTRAHTGRPSARRINKNTYGRHSRPHPPPTPPGPVSRRVEGSPRPGPATFSGRTELALSGSRLLGILGLLREEPLVALLG